MGIGAPGQADAYARELLGSPSYEDAQPRELKPVQLSSPFDLTRFVN
jgi:hypothetical protein